MNDTLLNSIEQVLDERDESQFDIYCALGDQLLKEFFIEQSHQQLYAEAASSSNNSNGKDVFNDKGRIPTLTKLGDWFVRFITKLKSWYVRKRTSKMVDKIKNMKIYKDHQNEPNYEYQVIFPDDLAPGNWVNMQDGYGGMNLRIGVTWIRWIRGDVQQIMRNLAREGDNFKAVVRQANQYKERASELWGDIKHITAVNTSSARKRTITQSRLRTLLDSLEESSSHMKENITQAYDAKDNVKSICKELISRNSANEERWKKISEQYVKFVTDLVRAWLYMCQCEMRIAERIYHSLGERQTTNTSDV